MFRSIINAAVLVALLAACTALFVLHSLYYIFRYAENTSKTEVKTTLATQLEMPALVICNQMPFSQDGMNAISPNIRQENSIRYLREWIIPSLREKADFFPVPPSALRQGADTLAQYIPTLGRNSSIQQMQYDCQSVISACSYQGVQVSWDLWEQPVQLSSYDCCKNLISISLSGPVGLCWLLHDRSMVQNNTLGPDKQFTILFQIPRNSWFSASYMPVHPGIDIYLIDGNSELFTIEQYLTNPIRLRDKRGVRLKMHKESRAFTRRPACGQALGDSRRADTSNKENNHTALMICHISVSIRYCGCHPIAADLMAYNRQQFVQFSRLIDTSNVEQYEACSRRYIDLVRGDDTIDIPKDIPGREQLEKCRDDNERRCVATTYPGQYDEFDLPPEYQNNQDFVARLSLQYDSMRVTEVLESKDPNLYEMLSYIGYNLALWFSIGHIIWLIYASGRDACCSQPRSGKVGPMEEEVTGENPL